MRGRPRSAPRRTRLHGRGLGQLSRCRCAVDRAAIGARAEDERPIADRPKRLAGRDERAGIRARSLLLQRHYREETDDADGDERALDETSCNVSRREAFILPLEDR